jgi:hypothetical protein
MFHRFYDENEIARRKCIEVYVELARRLQEKYGGRFQVSRVEHDPRHEDVVGTPTGAYTFDGDVHVFVRLRQWGHSPTVVAEVGYHSSSKVRQPRGGEIDYDQIISMVNNAVEGEIARRQRENENRNNHQRSLAALTGAGLVPAWLHSSILKSGVRGVSLEVLSTGTIHLELNLGAEQAAQAVEVVAALKKILESK